MKDLEIIIKDSVENGLEIKSPLFHLHLDSLSVEKLKRLICTLLDLYEMM